MYPDKADFSDITEDITPSLKSRFGFLSCHDGLKLSKMHLLLAPTHSGKSTLIRTLIVDAMLMNPNHKFMVWLTEETKEEFLKELKKCFPIGQIDESKLRVFSQQNYINYSDDEVIKFIDECVEHNYTDFLFVDNITTTTVYEGKKPATQSDIANWFKMISKKIGLFLVAHTNGNDFNNTLLDETSIRGSKTITNLTEFLYILQPININKTTHQFILLKKHRGESVSEKFFKLNYDPRLFSFKSDHAVEFDDIAWVFQQRNQLSKKVKRD